MEIVYWVLAAVSFAILWWLAGHAGWYHEILRVALILCTAGGVLIYWLRNA